MKLTAPLKTPAKNMQQRIFKFVLFALLPAMAILTVYAFVNIKANKSNAAQRVIMDQSGNVNKRITIFFDPIFRNIHYLRALGTTPDKKYQLDPVNQEAVRKRLELLSGSYLQHVRYVITWSDSLKTVYELKPGNCIITEQVLDQTHTKFLDEMIAPDGSDKVEWEEGLSESSMMAAVAWTAQNSDAKYAIAMDVDATEFFDDIKNDIEERLFLLSDESKEERLPRQFIITEGKPDIEATKDSVVIAAYTQWKNRPSDTPEMVRRLQYDATVYWVSVRPLAIKDLKLYSGLILPESELIAETLQEQKLVAYISLISFVIILMAAIFLWRRYQQDLEQSALPPALNQMTDEKLLQAITAGESDQLEFKSTMRWNLRTNKPDKAMEIACLKTIAAFLNSDGGTLLVGVQDDGSILGIAADQFPDEDKFMLHFNNLINQHLGLENMDSFSFDIRHLDAGDIMIVDCLPSPSPVYVSYNAKEEFYVRVGPGTRPLTTRDALEYIRNHF